MKLNVLCELVMLDPCGKKNHIVKIDVEHAVTYCTFSV